MKLREYYGFAKVDRDNTPSLFLNNDEEYVGVEFEIENVIYNFDSSDPEQASSHNLYSNTEGKKLIDTLYPYWLITKDGSLRHGSEFIFNGPLAGDNIITALSRLQDFLGVHRYNGRPAKVSNRCSVHVHLNAGEWTKPFFDKFLLIYLLTEKVLFRTVHPGRVKNNYCRMLSDSIFINYFTHNLLPIKDFNETFSSFIHYNCEKYSALNLKPLARFGTVEFRHHHGTTDLKEVLNWINIIFSLVNAAKKFEIEDLIKKEAKDILSDIFEDTIIVSSEFMSEHDDVEYLIKQGVNTVASIISLEDFNKISKSLTRPSSKSGIYSLYLDKYKLPDKKDGSTKAKSSLDSLFESMYLTPSETEIPSMPEVMVANPYIGNFESTIQNVQDTVPADINTVISQSLTNYLNNYYSTY